MKFRSVCLLTCLAAAADVNVQAFFVPTAVPNSSKSNSIISNANFRKSSASPNSVRNSLIVTRSMAAVESDKKKSFNDVTEFNVELDRLAELSGAQFQHVISRAAECQELYESQLHDSSVVPDTISFNSILKAWSRCCHALSEKSRNHGSFPDDVGHEVPVYTTRDAAERATTLLLEQDMNEDGPRPDANSYNIVIDAWAKSRVEDAPQAAERLLKRMLDHDDIEPDTFSYQGVLDAWAQSGSEEALGKVGQIYKHMEGLHKSGKNVKPSIRTVNAVLNAYSKRAASFTNSRLMEGDKAAECAYQALEILQEAKQKYKETQDPALMPDVMTYTTVMDTFARCGMYKTTLKAEELLRELKNEYEKSKNKRQNPNYRTYTTLITAWSRTKSPESPERAEAILKQMGDDPMTRPNARTYTTLIQCYAKSRDNNKARRALEILRDMKEMYKETGNAEIRPNILTYNAAIDACARCQGNLEQQGNAIKIAFAILKAAEQDEHVQPNHITYATLIRATAHQLTSGPERSKVAAAVFTKAKEKGLVDFTTLKNLRKAVDITTMAELCDGIADQNGSVDYNNIPAAWSKNIK